MRPLESARPSSRYLARACSPRQGTANGTTSAVSSAISCQLMVAASNRRGPPHGLDRFRRHADNGRQCFPETVVGRCVANHGTAGQVRQRGQIWNDHPAPRCGCERHAAAGCHGPKRIHDDVCPRECRRQSLGGQIAELKRDGLSLRGGCSQTLCQLGVCSNSRLCAPGALAPSMFARGIDEVLDALVGGDAPDEQDPSRSRSAPGLAVS